jgi:hypothetical protein
MTAVYEQIKFLTSNGPMFLSIAKEDLKHNKNVSPHYLTPCSQSHSSEPATPSPGQKFLPVYGTFRCITMFTATSYWSLVCAT